MPRQPVRVQIFNQNYSLVTETDPREVQEVAQQVDELMTSIANRISSGDTTRVAVLACLHLADKLRAMEKQMEVQSDRMATLVDEIVDAATSRVSSAESESTEPRETPQTA